MGRASSGHQDGNGVDRNLHTTGFQEGHCHFAGEEDREDGAFDDVRCARARSGTCAGDEDFHDRDEKSSGESR
jgi:hypothetical protein